VPRHTVGRLLTAGSLTLALGAGSATFGAGSAAAAEPLILSSCATAVTGQPGETVTLSPGALMMPIVDALAPLDPLGVIVPPFRQVWSGLPPIRIGTIPVGTALIPGDQIANAVIGQLGRIPVLGPVLDVLTGRVLSLLSGTCGVVVQGVTAVGGAVGVERSGPQQPPGAPGTGPKPPAPGTPGTPPGGNPPAGGATPPASGALPVEPVGFGALLRNGIPGDGLPLHGVVFSSGEVGYIPQFGLTNPNAPDAEQLRATGRAETMASASSSGVGRPVVFAVLALALVIAQVVRIWALRRAD
jgi:hypothetical protein